MVARQRYYHIPYDAGILIFSAPSSCGLLQYCYQVPIKGWRYVVFPNTLP
jgi:hypothetical protein